MTPTPRSKMPPRRRAQGGSLAGAVYLILLAAGATILYLKFYEPLVDLVRMQDWEPVTCRIWQSKAEEVEKIPGAYRPQIRYYYEYEGKTYRDTQVWVMSRAADSKADVDALVRRYPAESQAICYVNPDNPNEAVLERGFKPALLVALAPLGMVLIGLAGFTSLVLRRAFPRARLIPLFAGPRSHQTATGLPRQLPPSHPVKLRPRRGLRSGLLMMVLIALVWNTLTFFLGREVFNNWRSGQIHAYVVTLTLFSVPFILAGLLLALLPVYLMRKLFLPRPVVTLEKPVAAIGESIRVSWRIAGRIDRIRRLRILLEGREEATYERDEQTLTDYEVFASLLLFSTQEAREIRQGECVLRVPQTLVASFESRHNKITWAIRMQTDSRPWPGINEDFELLILPARAAVDGSRLSGMEAGEAPAARAEARPA